MYIVNSVEGLTGEPLVFYQIVYRPAEGFPAANELITNTTSAEECHLRLTQPAGPTLPSAPYGNISYPLINATYPMNATYPTGNSTLPPTTASGIVTLPTGTSPASPLSTGSTPVGTCAKGSRELYLGTIMGQTGFPIEYALAMSNGPCGRFSVWPIPVNSTASNSTNGGVQMRARGIGYQS
jgi:hypothetical protein